MKKTKNPTSYFWEKKWTIEPIIVLGKKNFSQLIRITQLLPSFQGVYELFYIYWIQHILPKNISMHCYSCYQLMLRASCVQSSLVMYVFVIFNKLLTFLNLVFSLRLLLQAVRIQTKPYCIFRGVINLKNKNL